MGFTVLFALASLLTDPKRTETTSCRNPSLANRLAVPNPIFILVVAESLCFSSAVAVFDNPLAPVHLRRRFLPSLLSPVGAAPPTTSRKRIARQPQSRPRPVARSSLVYLKDGQFFPARWLVNKLPAFHCFAAVVIYHIRGGGGGGRFDSAIRGVDEGPSATCGHTTCSMSWWWGTGNNTILCDDRFNFRRISFDFGKSVWGLCHILTCHKMKHRILICNNILKLS